MIAVCTACDRIDTMTACACGGVVVQLPGWVRHNAEHYALGSPAGCWTDPCVGLGDITKTDGDAWEISVYGGWQWTPYRTAGAAFQAVMAMLATLTRYADDALVAFLVENSRADETRETTDPR